MQQEKIGIIWPGKVDDDEYLMDENVRIIDGVRVDEAAKCAEILIKEGADILIGTPSMMPELLANSSVPVVNAFADYIDILESLEIAEKLFYPAIQKAALVFHISNPIQLERIDKFTKFQMGYYRYSDSDTLDGLIESIKKEGFKLLISGPTVIHKAREAGMDVFQLRYHGQSLIGGIQKARDILRLIREREHQIRTLNTVFNIIPDGVLMTDNQGMITMCNTQMEEYLGLQQNFPSDQPIDRLLKDKSWVNVYQNGISQTHALVKYNGISYFSTRRPVIEDGKIIGAIGLIQEADKIQNMERKYRYNQIRGSKAKYHFSDIVYRSEYMCEIVEQAKHCAKFNTTILIEGETGTGKEVFAQSIHNESACRRGPFVAVNCAAISSSLLESELMGYAEGAFTGAKRGGKPGLFELAHNGTIFLDEINQMPLDLQPKILRVLQERTVTRVGGLEEIPINVRIIAATNADLSRLVENGSFRRDLYYRLNVFSLVIPPLRERQEDIRPLIEYFFNMHPDFMALPADFWEKISPLVNEYKWPGNVRELQNFVERCIILEPETVIRDYFHRKYTMGGNDFSATEKASDREYVSVKISTLRNMEQKLVQAVVDYCDGNKSKAALLLDVNRNTINGKLKGAKKSERSDFSAPGKADKGRRP